MVLVSESIMYAGTHHAPNNVQSRFTLRNAARAQANVLSPFNHAERRFSVSKWHPIMAHMDDGGGYPGEPSGRKSGGPTLQIHRMVKPSIEAPRVFIE